MPVESNPAELRFRRRKVSEDVAGDVREAAPPQVAGREGAWVVEQARVARGPVGVAERPDSVGGGFDEAVEEGVRGGHTVVGTYEAQHCAMCRASG